jgi:putative inorganic carbon (hco3(-)) transporter
MGEFQVLSEHVRPTKSSQAITEPSIFWSVQGWGLIVIVFTTFFPALFHKQEALFFLLLLSAVVVQWRAGKPIWVRTPIDLPLLAFVAWVLITVPFAIDSEYSFGEWRKLAVQVLVFYWTLLVLQQQDQQNLPSRLLIAFALGATTLSVLAIHDFVMQGGTWRDRIVRAGAPSSDYNWLTTYMVIVIPMLAAMTLLFHEHWKRVLVGLVTGLAILTQVVSYTRAGWLGMIAEAIMFAWIAARRQVVLWLLVVLVVVGATLGLAYSLGYQHATLDPWTLVDARMGAWKLQVKETFDHPLVGIGYGSGTFMKRFAGYPETEKANGPHSMFFMVAVGSGIPALLLLVWMISKTVKVLLERSQQPLPFEASVFILAVAIMAVGFMTRNLFDYMFAGSLAFLYWMVVATALHWSESEKGKMHLGGRADSLLV